MAKKQITLSAPKGIEDLSKNELTSLAIEQADFAVEEGMNTLKMRALASKLEHFAGAIKTSLTNRASLRDEINSYGKQGVCIAGVQLQIVETSIDYDYSHDPVWIELRKLEMIAVNRRKAHEKLLRAVLHEGKFMNDEFTGEVYKAAPPLKSASETIKATIL